MTTVRIDGHPVELPATPERTLLSALATVAEGGAVRGGCLDGRCGTCLVLLDGRLVPSCLVMTEAIDGVEIVTAAGCDPRIGAALVGHGAVQCGFCTPGFAVSLQAVLNGADVEEALASALCRCTGYVALRAVAERIAGCR